MISLPSCSTIAPASPRRAAALSDSTLSFYNSKNSSLDASNNSLKYRQHGEFTYDSSPSTLLDPTKSVVSRCQNSSSNKENWNSSGYGTIASPAPGKPPLPETKTQFERDIMIFALQAEAVEKMDVMTRDATYLPRDYVKEQPQISAEMRSTLIDWLVEISASQRFAPNRMSALRDAWLTPDVLPLAVNYLDRFLNNYKIDKAKFQLLGLVALFVALKMCCEHLPDKDDLTGLTADTYTSDQIIKMEVLLLKTLQQRLLPPILPTFYNYFLHATHAPSDIILPNSITQRSYPGLFCQFLTELSLLDYGISIHYRPSEVALAQVLLFRLQIQNISKSPQQSRKPQPLTTHNPASLSTAKKVPPSTVAGTLLDVYRGRSEAALRHINAILSDGVFSSRLKYLARASRCSKGNVQTIMLGFIRMWRGFYKSNSDKRGRGSAAQGLWCKFLQSKSVVSEFEGLYELCTSVPVEHDVLRIFKTKYNYEV